MIRILLALLLLTSLACTKPTTDERKATQVISQEEIKRKDSIFYHDTTFMKERKHGEVYRLHGKGKCQLCHGDDLLGGQSGKSCNNCHQDFPHDEAFLNCAKGVDDCRPFDNRIGDINSCQKCHQLNQKIPDKMSPDSASYPFAHTEKFKMGASHGALYLQEKSSCLFCHQSDQKSTNKEKLSCYNCHNFPHESSGWTTSTLHGIAFEKEWKGEQKKDWVGCLDCHGEAKGKKSQSCKSCHQVTIPHTGEFIDHQHHSPHKLMAKKFFKQCMVCHLSTDAKGREKLVVEDLSRFMPKSFKLQNSQGCIECHQKREMDRDFLIDKELIEKQRDIKLECKICHVTKKLKLISDHRQKKLKGKVKSCATCHNIKEMFFPNH